ncbi:DUF4183 domain-containing protein [Psychrobacillus lasiicapitis]|uniref:DUF4183 domain-containing protein n=1 Tax=Psychrobacillus lasiicapitis TaxID=1636719 RepID=A0A544TAP7_9BACI|nr:DUF4183 domain-containing protein [Psychrobacillus lasiicapitis]TQR14537.1 DUF4183 domain-containing protein [Psychrobacillus lasiicapitis]GGA30521.1 hypothetical protein GCM10011384_19960 [Psychrobacillus lasiicapitis]
MGKHKKPQKIMRVYDCHTNRRRFVCKSFNEITIIAPPVVNVIPTVKRYFYIPEANLNLASGTTIFSNLFTDDDGNQVTNFMSFNPNGYANLYINGVIQEGGLYTVNTQSLTIAPVNSTISAQTPIIVELLTFSTTLS